MLSFEDAVAKVLALARPLGVEHVSVDAALGRAIASSITAVRTLPFADTCAMDGYAVRAADCPGSLTVVEKIFAGQRPKVTIEAKQCARVMTGAIVPPGADAVVMQEKTREHAHGVEVFEALAAGTNVRRRGEDVQAGALLFQVGRCVGLGEAGLLWAQGLTEVTVFQRPRVAIMATGDELCPVGGDPDDSVIDTNSPVLGHAVLRAGGTVTHLGVCPDDLEMMTARLASGLSHDVLLTVSGASVGERDYTQDAFKALGVELCFSKVAMKPGKPLLVGRKGSTLVFGLPGNPTSALVTFELFVRPALRALQGLPPNPLPMFGRLDGTVSKAIGLRLFTRARASVRDGECWATPLASQSSGALQSAAGATHLISVPPDVTTVSWGEKVALIPVAWGP